jgi:hypothetical protein
MRLMCMIMCRYKKNLIIYACPCEQDRFVSAVRDGCPLAIVW